MLQIRQGFLFGANGKVAGHLAAAQPGKLRKNEPHPVTAFFTGTQFFLNPLKDRVLSLDETWQVKSIELIGASHAKTL
jgi:hypothetical protein